MDNGDYKDFILGKFSGLDVISAKKMFGGYVFHMAGKVLGFVFDGEFLFEPGPTIDRLLPDAVRKELFPGSKLFVVIDESIDSHSFCRLAEACYDDLPVSKPRKKRGDPSGRQSSSAERQRREEIEKRFPFAKNFRD